MALVYNKVETTTTTRQVTVGGQVVDVEVPGPGQTDLCMALVAIEGDLAVNADGITVAPDSPLAGGAVNISAEIENVGLQAAENIAVDFYMGDPASGGGQIGHRQTIVGPLAPGSKATASVTDIPVPPAAYDVRVVVDPDLSFQDRDRTNNTANVSPIQAGPERRLDELAGRRAIQAGRHDEHSEYGFNIRCRYTCRAQEKRRQRHSAPSDDIDLTGRWGNR